MMNSKGQRGKCIHNWQWELIIHSTKQALNHWRSKQGRDKKKTTVEALAANDINII